MSFLTSSDFLIAVPSWLSEDQKLHIRQQIPRYLSICEHHDAALRGRRVQVNVVELASYTARSLQGVHAAIAFDDAEEFDSFVQVEQSQPKGHKRNYLKRFVGEHAVPACRSEQEFYFYPTAVRTVIFELLGHKPVFSLTGRELMPKVK